MKHATSTSLLARLLARLRATSGATQRTVAQAPYHATRKRLVLINLAVVSAILLLMATSIYFFESQALQQQVELQLRNRADSELAGSADIIAERQAHPTTVLPADGQEHDSGAEHYEPNSPNIFTIVLDASGATMLDASAVSSYGLPDHSAAAPVFSGKQRESLAHARIEDQEYLLLSKAVYSRGKLVGVLQVGQSLAPMEQQTHGLLLILALVGVGALTLTAGASLYLADRALAPMRLAYERQHQFAVAASHELRTPLAFVRSQLELVSRRLARAQVPAHEGAASPVTLTESVREDLDETLNEVDYMTRLVRDLLLMARDEGDHRSITWSPVNLTSLARDVAETAQPSALQKGLTLDDHTANGEPVWTVGDHDRLRQLLLILLDNAIRYTPAGGHVWIKVCNGRGSLFGGRRPLAQIIVGDTGVGIAPDQQERIFEAFYRPKGHSGATTDHGNAGLGLALARWLVGAHDGDISVRSAPGEGSVFTISLPFHAERRTPSIEDSAHADERASLTQGA